MDLFGVGTATFRAEPGLAYPGGHEGLSTDGLDVPDGDGMLVLSVGAMLVTMQNRLVIVGPHFPDAVFPPVRPGCDAVADRSGALAATDRGCGVAAPPSG